MLDPPVDGQEFASPEEGETYIRTFTEAQGHRVVGRGGCSSKKYLGCPNRRKDDLSRSYGFVLEIDSLDGKSKIVQSCSRHSHACATHVHDGVASPILHASSPTADGSKVDLTLPGIAVVKASKKTAPEQTSKSSNTVTGAPASSESILACNGLQVGQTWTDYSVAARDIKAAAKKAGFVFWSARSAGIRRMLQCRNGASARQQKYPRSGCPCRVIIVAVYGAEALVTGWKIAEVQLKHNDGCKKPETERGKAKRVGQNAKESDATYSDADSTEDDDDGDSESEESENESKESDSDSNSTSREAQKNKVSKLIKTTHAEPMAPRKRSSTATTANAPRKKGRVETPQKHTDRSKMANSTRRGTPSDDETGDNGRNTTSTPSVKKEDDVHHIDEQEDSDSDIEYLGPVKQQSSLDRLENDSLDIKPTLAVLSSTFLNLPPSVVDALSKEGISDMQSLRDSRMQEKDVKGIIQGIGQVYGLSNIQKIIAENRICEALRMP